MVCVCMCSCVCYTSKCDSYMLTYAHICSHMNSHTYTHTYTHGITQPLPNVKASDTSFKEGHVSAFQLRQICANLYMQTFCQKVVAKACRFYSN